MPQFNNHDMFLVYKSQDGSFTYMHFKDVDDMGAPIEPDNGDDMKLVGWTTNPPADEI